jgi:hypothetical protein
MLQAATRVQRPRLALAAVLVDDVAAVGYALQAFGRFGNVSSRSRRRVRLLEVLVVGVGGRVTFSVTNVTKRGR